LACCDTMSTGSAPCIFILPDAMDDNEKLKELLKWYSVHYGDFVLASGKKSNVYVDCRLTTLRAEAMPLIGEAILAQIAERDWKADLVGGLTMGADPVVSAVVRESLGTPQVLNGFLIRKEAKGHGRGQYLEGVREPGELKAVIVEDVCSTGGSAIQAIERAREFGLEVVGAVCLVDREMGGAAAIEATGCAFASVFTMGELLDL
jgi:orotate phosphoribosyltransferase